MIGQDGYLAGLAYGKNAGDKEFDREAETLRLRLKMAREKGEIEHPLHIGMIETVNALVTEIADIEAGRMKPDQARLSAKNNNEFLVERFQKEASEAMHRISSGKLELDFKESPEKRSPLKHMASSHNAKPVPAGKRSKPR